MPSSGKKGPLIAEILAVLRAIDADIERVDELAAARLGINATDFRCLDILGRGAPITAGQLASEAGLTTGAVTALVDRLERSGYVERRNDPRDRRRVLIAPTKRAMDRVWPLFAGIVASSTAVLESFTLDELQTIQRFLEKNRTAIRSQIAHLEVSVPRTKL
jgi:DNA-binding MarR family transcriptional regulator